MEKYEVTETPEGITIKRLSDGAFIPTDADNRDYQQYLEDVGEK